MVVEGAGGHNESVASQDIAVTMEALESLADSGPPAVCNTTTASPSNLGALGFPAVHGEAPERLMAQKPPDSSAAPEVVEQTDNPFLPQKDDVTIEVQEEEMQDLR